jgi:hypothetical protein
VLAPGTSKQALARTLNAAYARGLLSENTLAHRLDLLFGNGLVDSAGLVGDLAWRAPQRRRRTRIAELFATARRRLAGAAPSAGDPPWLLALDWSGAEHELTLGREESCDVVFTTPSVSRRHARLTFRDGSWVIQDLDSLNGTEVNGVTVGRCELRPGDCVCLGEAYLVID